tara:strand:+ start:83 stop:331 length:249 start_codon:yes stop_codon:yes gene_type:complete
LNDQTLESFSDIEFGTNTTRRSFPLNDSAGNAEGVQMVALPKKNYGQYMRVATIIETLSNFGRIDKRQKSSLVQNQQRSAVP